MNLLLNKRLILALLVLALVCGVTSWYLLKAYLDTHLPVDEPEMTETLSVLVPADTLPAGTQLQIGQLRFRQIPHSVFPEDIVTPAELETILGKVTSVELRAGLPIQWLQLLPNESRTFSELLAAGESAVSFILSRESGHGGNVEIGDLIDAVDSELGIAEFKGLEIIGIEGQWKKKQFDSGELTAGNPNEFQKANLLITVRTSKKSFAALKQGLSSGRLLPRLLNRHDLTENNYVKTVTYIYPDLSSQKELLCVSC